MDEQELTRLAEGLGRLILAGMGSRSRWALRTALDAANTEGIGGVLVVKVPSKCKDYCDIGFTIGEVDVVERWNSGR